VNKETQFWLLKTFRVLHSCLDYLKYGEAARIGGYVEQLESCITKLEDAMSKIPD